LLPDADRDLLLSWTRSTSAPAGLELRARIVLAASGGESNTAIAGRLGSTRQTVVTWWARYVGHGLAGLADRRRPGRPRVVNPLEVAVRTMEGPPERPGVTHWSSRLLAAEMAISDVAVASIWREHRLQPSRTGTFRFSADPELDARVRDVAGLYLAPPEKAAVIVRGREEPDPGVGPDAPMLPIAPGLPGRRTHDYKRAGTTTLSAALEAATGKITAGACYDRHRHKEFPAFLRQVAEADPRVELHVVCDNYATRKTPEVTAWLARNPGITLHFTPASGSWLNMAGIFFGIITRQAVRRDTFRPVHELTGAIRRYIDACDTRAKPFVWTKTAGQVLARARPARS
jgi:transposase